MKELFKQFNLTQLSSPLTLREAKNLSTEGFIQHLDNYCYLKVDDEFIHLLYLQLKIYGNLIKPEYFSSPKDIGAHISVVYPEEDVNLNDRFIGEKHFFSIEGLIKAQYGSKEYFALSASSESLVNMRKQYDLSPKPTFKGHQIVFHITIGIRNDLR